jgi:hypothetical protein
MVRDEDFLAAAAVATKALRTAEQALSAAQDAAAREIPAPTDLAALLDGVVRAIENIKLPAHGVTVEAAAPTVNVEAAQITVQAAAPAVNNFAPNVIVDVPAQPAPVVNVEAPTVNVEAPTVNVAAPRVQINVPEPTPLPRLPWRLDDVKRNRDGLIVSAMFIPVTTESATV